MPKILNGGFYDICQHVEYNEQSGTIHINMDHIVSARALFCAPTVSQGGDVI
jgi:hypothetical protein